LASLLPEARILCSVVEECRDPAVKISLLPLVAGQQTYGAAGGASDATTEFMKALAKTPGPAAPVVGRIRMVTAP